jgi:pimeloyl-ACP methyl ester carboxylesterase
MPEVETTSGTIEYEDTGGQCAAVVLLHGVLMDAGQWRDVAPGLAADYRVVRPTLPLGAHRRPMRPDADLSLRGQARLVAEFLERLDLREATLAFNDWAAPQLLIADGLVDRVAGLILVACETAGNYPPGLPGRNLALLGRIPGALTLALRAMRFRPIRRLPMTFGWMSKHGIPDELVDRWLDASLGNRRVVADLLKYVRGTPQGRSDLIAASDHLGSFHGPVTVIWSSEDRVMPVSEGRKLAEAFPNGRLVMVDDSYVLIPLDQPDRLTELIREHLARGHEPPRDGPRTG